jgi:hypothetical protein
MSLDVNLYKKVGSYDSLSNNQKALFHKEYADYLEGNSSLLPFSKWYKENNVEEVYWANITHNLGEMAGKAGIYEALWRPYKLLKNCPKSFENYELEFDFEENSTVLAKLIIPYLEKGLKDLKARPEYFKRFNSPNGWGMYEHFVPFVEKYLEACRNNPDALVEISR